MFYSLIVLGERQKDFLYLDRMISTFDKHSKKLAMYMDTSVCQMYFKYAKLYLRTAKKRTTLESLFYPGSRAWKFFNLDNEKAA